MNWHKSLGLDPTRLLFHQHTTDELAHYARAAFDIQFDFGGTLGFQEIEGVHNRGDFDLTRHQEYSGKKLEYFDQPNNRRFIPFVVETSVGADRTTLAAARQRLSRGVGRGRRRGPHRARIASGAGADQSRRLSARQERRHAGVRHQAGRTSCAQSFPVFYDESGAIGRRYRRQDEVGTPYCITVDGQTTQDGTVTIRDRDTLIQERVAADRVAAIIRQRLAT